MRIVDESRPSRGLDAFFASLPPAPEAPAAAPPATVPFPARPRLLMLRIEHIGDATIIARRFDRPEACNFCPRSTCDHGRGFCMQVINHPVPPILCPSYGLRFDESGELVGTPNPTLGFDSDGNPVDRPDPGKGWRP